MIEMTLIAYFRVSGQRLQFRCEKTVSLPYVPTSGDCVHLVKKDMMWNQGYGWVDYASVNIDGSIDVVLIYEENHTTFEIEEDDLYQTTEDLSACGWKIF